MEVQGGNPEEVPPDPGMVVQWNTHIHYRREDLRARCQWLLAAFPPKVIRLIRDYIDHNPEIEHVVHDLNTLGWLYHECYVRCRHCPDPRPFYPQNPFHCPRAVMLVHRVGEPGYGIWHPCIFGPNDVQTVDWDPNHAVR